MQGWRRSRAVRWCVESGSVERFGPALDDEAVARTEARRPGERLVVAAWEHDRLVEDRLLSHHPGTLHREVQHGNH